MALGSSSLSRKLLTRVFSVYFVLTLVVTATQIIAEYTSTKQQIEDELQTLQNTFSDSLTRAIWELNTPQAVSIAQGLMELPIVEGVQIRDEAGNYIVDFGFTAPKIAAPVGLDGFRNHAGGLFSYSFPLVFEFSGRQSSVGDVSLYSSFEIILGRIEVGIFFLIGNAIVKTTFLIFLFLTAFRRMLSQPLNAITEQMQNFDPENLQDSKLNVEVEDDNELKQLQYSYNQVISDLIESQTKLRQTQKDLTTANQKLDDQNLLLEQEVAKKTAALSQIMLDLEAQKDELLGKQLTLRQEIDNRQYVEQELRKRNEELAGSMDTLEAAQQQLVDSERMASLGGLVAGIAHDVNTPLGVGVTAASFLQERIKSLETAFNDKSITQSQMSSFIEEAGQTTALLMNNLNRASELIASFKQVAVDQTSEAERRFELCEYLKEVIQSLKPSFKNTHHTIEVDCDETLNILCAPGAIAQIITNLVMNSVMHGFEHKVNGHINISVEADEKTVTLKYSDDGIGLLPEHLDSLFDAFFTTKRSRGGSGLGTHIVYNLVTQSLNGQIEARSQTGKGLHYTIRFPRR
ncbi:sensor histidine kinase [Alteromonas oceanisediminis]|uniref:sensor histidine kinase n=1 Tax=Alteromonas oceanisediminis TaxID=2836180 RepID=UPI001BD91FC7|nr:HAMP domain-containing sensor histidine kinase [Alteromonas oceanisediminis]MBT0585295.1 HAMP domain-containing histidine kinase [Alteromonas oceanisediminis]